MAKNVLITGGTGLIGNVLTDLFLRNGYHVNVLSRSKRKDDRVNYYVWDLDKDYIEEGALDVDCVIHLAGAGIADQRWTEKRKKIIIDSRVKSTALLEKYLSKKTGPKPSYIGASAIGIYGAQDDHPVTEDEVETDRSQFLVDVTHRWEEAHRKLEPWVNNFSLIRIGIVLSTEGGALKPMLIPFNFRMGNYFGKGDQMMSWIHINDLASMIFYIAEHKISGTYNGVAPSPVSGKELVATIASLKPGPYLQFGAPEFILKLVFGEMSQAILMSTNVSANKIQSKAFTFEYNNIKEAISDLLRH